jgi:hypothetical protein
MGIVNRPQIQTMLQGIVEGTFSFDDYIQVLGLDPPSAQIQLRAAIDQRREGQWSQADYERIRDEIRAEYDLNFKRQQTAVAPPPKLFNPLAAEGKVTIPEGFKVTVLPTSMGRAEKRKGSETNPSDPVRTVSGTFRPHVAEVWFVSPTTGGIKRRMFVTGDCIAEAFKFANEISNESAHQPTALVKFRKGEMKGNRHVLLCTPDGYIVTPQTIVEWHGRNRLKAGVGEKISNLSLKVLKAMLAQNAEIRKAFGTTVDKHGTLKVCMGGCLDIPTLEPKDSKAVEYSLRMVSGDSRIIDIRPRTDKKDEDGNVTLAGHKRRAYELLLETDGVGADVPRNVQYTFDGKVFDVSRREAIDWTSEDEDEDPGMSALHAAFLEGHMDRDEYEERAGMLAEQLAVAQWEEDNPGRTAAQARYQNELVWARDEGIISEDSFEFMQSWSHPSHRDNKSGPTMWQRKTRVEYGKDGRMVWQRAKNDNTPGARWVGGQSVHEAQLYAQNR